MTSNHKEQIKHLTPDEVIQLMKHARYRTKRGHENKHGLRNLLIIAMLYRHGLRVSELIGLTWGNIDLKAGTIKFQRSKSRLWSIQELSEFELLWLSRIYQKTTPLEDAYLFSNSKLKPLDRRSILRMIKTVAKRAGLPNWVGCHTLRHSCGFMMGAQRVPIQEIAKWLGHVDIRNTMIYVHVDIRNLPCEDPISLSLFPADATAKQSNALSDLPQFDDDLTHYADESPSLEDLHPPFGDEGGPLNNEQPALDESVQHFYRTDEFKRTQKCKSFAQARKVRESLKAKPGMGFGF